MYLFFLSNLTSPGRRWTGVSVWYTSWCNGTVQLTNVKVFIYWRLYIVNNNLQQEDRVLLFYICLNINRHQISNQIQMLSWYSPFFFKYNKRKMDAGFGIFRKVHGSCTSSHLNQFSLQSPWTCRCLQCYSSSKVLSPPGNAFSPVPTYYSPRYKQLLLSDHAEIRAFSIVNLSSPMCGNRWASLYNQPIVFMFICIRLQEHVSSLFISTMHKHTRVKVIHTMRHLYRSIHTRLNTVALSVLPRSPWAKAALCVTTTVS